MKKILFGLLLLSAVTGCASIPVGDIRSPTAQYIIIERRPYFQAGGGTSYDDYAVMPDGSRMPVGLLAPMADIDLFEDNFPPYAGCVPDVGSSTVLVEVRLNPQHPSLAGYYSRHPDGNVLSPSFTIGNGPSMVYHASPQSDLHHPPLLLEHDAEPASFSFRVPRGFRTGFIIAPVRDGGGPGVRSVEGDPFSGSCPANEVFTATRSYPTEGWHSNLRVVFTGRSPMYGCAYALKRIDPDPS